MRKKAWEELALDQHSNGDRETVRYMYGEGGGWLYTAGMEEEKEERKKEGRTKGEQGGGGGGGGGQREMISYRPRINHHIQFESRDIIERTTFLPSPCSLWWLHFLWNTSIILLKITNTHFFVFYGKQVRTTTPFQITNCFVFTEQRLLLLDGQGSTQQLSNLQMIHLGDTDAQSMAPTNIPSIQRMSIIVRPN